MRRRRDHPTARGEPRGWTSDAPGRNDEIVDAAIAEAVDDRSGGDPRWEWVFARRDTASAGAAERRGGTISETLDKGHARSDIFSTAIGISLSSFVGQPR